MKFHDGSEVAADKRAALNVIRQRAGADDVERRGFWRCLEERADRMILLRRVGVRNISRGGRAAAQRIGSAHHTGHGPVTFRPAAGFVTTPAEEAEAPAPALPPHHTTPKETFEPH